MVFAATYHIHVIYSFGFDSWLKSILSLKMSNPYWFWSLANVLVLITGLLIWSRIEASYVIITPLVLLIAYFVIIAVIDYANIQRQLILIGYVHVALITLSAVASPFALWALNEELKFEWQTTIFDILAYPIRALNRLLSRRPSLLTEIPENPIPQDVFTKQAPEEPEQPIEGRPEMKWYDRMIELQRQRYRR